jgi:hypothetical protein
MKKHKKIILFFIVLIIAAVAVFLLANNFYSHKKINTMLMLIEFENVNGVLQWEKELDQRGLTALVKVQDNVLQAYPDVFKGMADKGYEIAGGYDQAAFWGMPYEEQYNYMKEAKNLVECVTGKTMRVFGSRYFAYDENTLKAAQDLGIEYILARGTKDVEAVIYKPSEYNVKIISVSNVDFGDMGRGSLCDYSLWARGSSPENFGEMVQESITKNPKNMILVSHAYLGGTRLEWWQEYQKTLNSDKLSWNGFDDWINNHELVYLNNSEIPVNTQVEYTTPTPIKAIEDYEAIPDLEEVDISEVSSEEEMICQ